MRGKHDRVYGIVVSGLESRAFGFRVSLQGIRLSARLNDASTPVGHRHGATCHFLGVPTTKAPKKLVTLQL